MSGSMGRSVCPLGRIRPVNAARPRVAATPHKNVAPAMYRYPRRGCVRLGKTDESAFLFFGVLDHVADLDGLVQHGGNRTVLLFRKPHRIFHRFMRDVSTDSVDQTNLRIDGRWGRGPFRLGPHFDTGEGLALLTQD